MERIAHWCPIEIDEIVPRRAPADIERANEIVWNADARQRHESLKRIAAGAGETEQLTATNLLPTHGRWHALAFNDNLLKFKDFAEVDFHLCCIAHTHLQRDFLCLGIGRMRDG